MQEFGAGQWSSITSKSSAVTLYVSLLEMENCMIAHELISMLSEAPLQSVSPSCC